MMSTQEEEENDWGFLKMYEPQDFRDRLPKCPKCTNLGEFRIIIMDTDLASYIPASKKGKGFVLAF